MLPVDIPDHKGHSLSWESRRSAKREVVGSNLGRTSLRGRRSRGKGKRIRARDLSPSRAQIPPSPSPFNACHAG